jgi:hypothetical protein
VPKLSVYVTDDLWNRVKSVTPATTSQIVQEALTLLVETKSAGPAYGAKPPLDTELARDYLRTQYSIQARQRFEQGYRNAVTYLQSSQVPWKDVESFADAEFDVRRWIAPWFKVDEGLEPELPDWLVRLGEDRYLGVLARPDDADGFYPDRTYLFGFGRALRDVWRSVEYGNQPPRVSNRPKLRRQDRSEPT